jgi:N-acetyl-anhydromuramoyl-L-alanine amidase
MMKMRIDLTNSLLDAAKYLPSPHHNERPANTAIELIILHNISLPPGEFGTPYINDFFCGQLDATKHPYFKQIVAAHVAPHLLIRREGAIIQYVPFAKRAWHAGESCYQGKKNCNDFSIGVELEGTDEIPYTIIQYQQLAAVVQALMTAYPTITEEKIVGHCDVAPDRKTDPGKSFDWGYFFKHLRS